MIDELAGLVGIDPRPFTLRELWQMGAGRWAPFAELLAQQVNLHRDSKKGFPLRGVDLNPYADAEDKKRIVSEGPIAPMRKITGWLGQAGWQKRKLTEAERASLKQKE